MGIFEHSFSYLVILLISLFGIGFSDWRYKLVIFHAPRAAIKTWGILMGIFLLWDIAGIALKVFSTNQRYVVGAALFSPDLPVEEFLFLTLLIYTSLWFYNGLGRWRGSHV